MFFFCLVFVVPLCASVYLCLVVTCWEGLTSWLSFVVYNCEFVTFPLVSWVMYGTWLYRFLIFASLLTFIPQTRDWNGLPESVISFAEIADAHVAKVTTLVRARN